MAKVADATSTLARYALELSNDVLPAGVAQRARSVLADTLGVMYAASTHAAVRTALRALPATGGRCTVIGHGRGASAEVASFVNGIGGHDIELDDSHSPSRTHPAAVIVAAGLAAAELSPDATYGDLLAAIVGAYDVEARVSKAIGRNAQYDRGFHPTAVCGAIGAAVCAGRILRLSLDQMRYCIGLAASQSSGLLTYEDDPSHMAKSFQTGIAARNGVTAALFARAGYRSAPDVLTGHHGALRPFGGEAVDPSKLVAELGTHFEICQTSLKRHASCGLTHAAVDALLGIRDSANIAFGEIEGIDVQLPHRAVASVDGNTLWTHNIQYVLALAAHEGLVGLDHFSERWTGDPRIAELRARVTLRGSDRLEERFPEKKGAIVTVRTHDRELAEEVEAPRGSPAQPLTERELRDKFLHLAGLALDAASAASLWTDVTTRPPTDPARPLLDALAQEAPAIR